MKELSLGRNGMKALLDDADYDRLSGWTWYSKGVNDRIYAWTKHDGHNMLLHRAVMEAKADETVRFKSDDTLDCQRQNLEVTKLQEPRKRREPKTDEPKKPSIREWLAAHPDFEKKSKGKKKKSEQFHAEAMKNADEIDTDVASVDAENSPVPMVQGVSPIVDAENRNESDTAGDSNGGSGAKADDDTLSTGSDSQGASDNSEVQNHQEPIIILGSVAPVETVTEEKEPIEEETGDEVTVSGMDSPLVNAIGEPAASPVIYELRIRKPRGTPETDHLIPWYRRLQTRKNVKEEMAEAAT